MMFDVISAVIAVLIVMELAMIARELGEIATTLRAAEKRYAFLHRCPLDDASKPLAL